MSKVDALEGGVLMREQEVHSNVAKMVGNNLDVEDLKFEDDMCEEQNSSQMVQRNVSLKVGAGLARDEHMTREHLAVQGPSSCRPLFCHELGFPQPLCPIWGRGAMRRPRHRIFQNGGLWCEKARNEVAVFSGCSHDDASRAQLDPVEKVPLDAQILYIRGMVVDQKIVP